MRIKRTNGIDGMYMGGVRQSQHYWYLYAKNSSLYIYRHRQERWLN